MSTREFDGATALEGFPNTWKRVMTDPRGFFADMPEVGGLQAPLAFLGVSAVINAAGHLVFGWGLGGFVRIVQYLFSGRAGFEATFRVVAYAAAPTVLAWLPWIGVLAVVYGVYLTVVGLERVHGFDTTRAVLTVGIGLAVMWLVFVARRRPFLP